MYLRLFSAIGLLCCLHVNSIQAQRRLSYPRWWELGVGVYATNYSGDLAPDHISLAATRIGGSLFARHHLSSLIQVRASGHVVHLVGDDRNYPPNAGRSFRFRANVLELSGQVEVTLANIAYDPPRRNTTYHFAPYVFAGIGGAWFSPKVTYYGPESERPLHEREPIPEGGRKQRSALVVPFGLGFRYIASDFITLGAEVCARPAPSDLIDGVSLNGNPNHRDWYYTAGLTCSYFLNGPWYPRR